MSWRLQLKEDMTGLGVTRDVRNPRPDIEWGRRTRLSPTPRRWGKGHQGEQGEL